MGGPGCAGIKSLEFGGLHLAGGQGAAFQAANWPGERPLGDIEHPASGIGDLGVPAASQLDATHTRINQLAAAAAGAGPVFFCTKDSLAEHGAPRLVAGGLRVLAMARQGGDGDGGGAVEAQLHIPAIEQGIEARDGHRQTKQARGFSWLQGPGLMAQFRCGSASEKIPSNTATRARRNHGCGFPHAAGKRQERGLGLARLGGLG